MRCWRAVVAALVCAGVARGAHGQQRSLGAITLGDLASGSLTSLSLCGKAAPLPNEGVTPAIPSLPSIPGDSGPVVRNWHFAGALGGAAGVRDVQRNGERSVALASGRVHFTPAGTCAFDAFLTLRGAAPTAAAAVLEARWVVGPRLGSVPAFEAGIGATSGGSRAGDADVRPDATLRFTASTPNLAVLADPILARLLGHRAPRFDVRARLFGGAAVPVQAEPDGSRSRAVFSQVGGTGLFSILHVPVSLVAGVERSAGEVPANRPLSRETAGLAWRLRCCDDNAWIVARATRLAGNGMTVTAWSLEFAHLLVGSR